MSNLVGFNPDEVKFALTTYSNSYEAIMDRLGDLQTKFINEMSTKWACNEAITFFDAFKTDIDKLIKGIDSIFANVNESVNSAAKAWANATSTEYTQTSFNARGLTMNVDCIKENIEGGRGAEPGISSIATSVLPYTAEQVEYQIKGCVTATNASGFLGGNQQSSLIEAFNKIKNDVTTAMNKAADATTDAIKATEDAYGTLETKVSTAFAGNE